MHNILILGTRSPASLTWARLLTQTGYRVHTADSLRFPLSRFSNSSFTYTRLPPPRQQPRQWLKELIQLLVQLNIHTIIPNCEEVFYLAAANSIIQQAHPCQFFTSSITLLEQLHHKGHFAELTQNWPITVPETVLLTDQAKLEIFKQQKFPTDKQWVFKPAYSRFATRTLICPQTSEYNQINPTTHQPWIAQQYIQGKEYCSYSIIQHGQLIAHSCYHPKYRVGQGAGIYFSPAQQPKIREFIKYFATQTQYHGQVGFDFIQDAAGKLYVIECNPRATSGIHFLSQLPQIIQTAIVNAVMQVDTEIVTNQVQMDYMQPAMHNIAMLCTPQLWRHLVTAVFWQDYKNAQDVVWKKTDMLPYCAQIITTIELLIRATASNIGPLAATTLDIEWDGTPVSFK